MKPWKASDRHVIGNSHESLATSAGDTDGWHSQWMFQHCSYRRTVPATICAIVEKTMNQITTRERREGMVNLEPSSSVQ